MWIRCSSAVKQVKTNDNKMKDTGVSPQSEQTLTKVL